MVVQDGGGMKYAAYPQYSPSASIWLDRLPSHWQQLRVKHVIDRMESGVSVNAEASPAQPGEVGVLKTSCVYGDQFQPSENKRVLEDELDRVACRVKADRLIISRMNTPDLVGSCGYVPQDYPDLFLPDRLWQTVFNAARGCLPRYVWYYLTSRPAKSAISSLAAGTSGSMQNIAQDAFMGISFPLPPLEEQRSIVRFLDAKTAQIDALIAKKRQLIETLKEKRQALISRTVTRGLSDVPTTLSEVNMSGEWKDSGVAWFGLVPAHWEVKQLKWAITFQRGHDLPAEQREEGRIPLVSSAGVSGRHSIATAKGPGIVTGRYGTIGKFHLLRDDYWPLNTTLYSIDLHGNYPEYLCFMLEHLSELVLLHSVKSAVPGVDRNDLHPTIVALPPIEEQKVLASFLTNHCQHVSQVVATAEAAIARLVEYRQALIAAAVVGQIDVREAA